MVLLSLSIHTLIICKLLLNNTNQSLQILYKMVPKQFILDHLTVYTITFDVLLDFTLK